MSSKGWVVKTTNKELMTYVGSVEKRGDDILENHQEENGRRRVTNMLKVLRMDTNASIWACEKNAGDCISEGDGISVGGISHSIGKSKRCCVAAELGESSLTASTNFLVSAACTI